MNRDVAEVEQACADLARKGQVLNADGIEEWPDGTVSGRYAFLHAFYQEVLYERLPPGRRANLHRRIGSTLEARYDTRTGEIAAVLALHFEEGRDLEKAIRYLAAAAESSDEAFRQPGSRRYLDRA